MVSIIQAVFLGFIQGVTEWLPISSSGHLALVQHYFGISVPVAFDVLLHIGTASVIFFVFRDEIKKIILSLFYKKYQEYRKILLYVFIGSLATAIIGFIGKDFFKGFFTNISAIGAMLIFTSIILFASKFHVSGKKKEIDSTDSLLIGLAQGLAIIPGISRSGTTISMALIRGIDREEAAKFSFILSLPAVLGAGLLEWQNLVEYNIGLYPALIGLITAIIVGYTSLKTLLRILKDNRFHYFGWYCAILGSIIAALG
jgi:undecaprenyl-diphosphatase